VEVTIQSLSEVSREVEITATTEDLAPHFDKAYQEHRKKIEIRGFRKGKAPLDIIKKLYGDLIENESLNEIATEMYRKAVKEKELKPIGEPVLIDMDYKRGESFRCKIQYDIRPTITVKQYKGIEVEKSIHAVTDNEIEKEIIRLQRVNAIMEEAVETSGLRTMEGVRLEEAVSGTLNASVDRMSIFYIIKKFLIKINCFLFII